MWRKYYPNQYVESVFAIDYGKLYGLGYRGIIFDIDNTLVHHGDDATPEVEALFSGLHSMGFRTLLLTNNDEQRVRRFVKHIDTLWICEADKPKPENYLQAVERLGVEKQETVFVGDQIFTDILGANRAGITNILVHFIRREGVRKIGKKRYLEQVILFFWKRSKWFGMGLGEIAVPVSSCACQEEGETYVQQEKEKFL